MRERKQLRRGDDVPLVPLRERLGAVTMILDRYVWPLWSSAFLVPWAALFLAFPPHRKTMIWASLFTTPFGLTEPLFVPEYWNPPSLFDLAQRTGFDIESLIFCFGIGGVGAVLHNILTGRVPHPVGAGERRWPAHRFHLAALATPFLAFPVLYLVPWNPIYSGIGSMAMGAVATGLCRPDLVRRMFLAGLVFVAYYTVFLLGLETSSPGFVGRVWNLGALTGILIGGMPLEELLFALCFGLYWSSVYEHVQWMRPVRVRKAHGAAANRGNS